MSASRRDGWGLAALPPALIVVVAAAAPLLTPFTPIEQPGPLDMRLLAPSWAHPFGTDVYSRDLLSRVLHGARISVAVGLGTAVIAALLGTTVGLLAGTGPRWLDQLLMRAVDALLSVPRVLMLIALAASFGTLPTWALVVVLGGTGWFTLARLVRDGARAASRLDFAQAARALGVGRWRFAWRHVLPTLAGTVLVAAVLTVGNAIAIEAGLSYLGLGVQPPAPSWGTLIHDGTEVLGQAWWTSVFPGLAIVGTVFACQSLATAIERRVGTQAAVAASAR
ncbi:MAG: ABC transporter permease [Gemmatimonadetes bacterium]|nr:ABC transporter permease [Gemmatimonadota bacterium]